MRAFYLLAILVLSACSGATLESLRQAKPTGTPFQQALAKYYLDFSDQEASRYDWWSSQHFAEKGLTATYGETVQPEKMEYWNQKIVSKNERAALAQARVWLTSHLNNPEKAPDDIARAQVYFDCWIEEATELGDSSAHRHCREETENLLMKLGPASATAASSSSQLLQAQHLTLTYLVLFDWNSASLNSEAREVLEIILTDLHNIDHYEIVLNGHADANGSQQANTDISLKRAKEVERQLIASGIPASAISIYAFGETDLKKATGDSAREKANRRVEVVIN